jgi:N6-L-threonylcarbamoyladenine synthase
VRLLEPVAFPYLVLLVSGGHCQLLIVRGVGRYRLLGTTLDDAAGECLDKGAAMLGLPYPGGPALEQAAKGGNPYAFDLPRPLKGRSDCAFSFSGLKTALRQRVEALTVHGPLSDAVRADLAASLQEAVADVVEDRVVQALTLLRKENGREGIAAGLPRPPKGGEGRGEGDTGADFPTALVAAGGVAANAVLRARLAALASTWGLPFKASPPALCTDNGIMVAWAGLERLRLGLTSPLSTPARPRWPLESLAVEGDG